ncbi:hypothetical protein FRC09_005399 [Ceratobasidium sp. 395]|nr:hypothetical protein FRC09_005399 [Ceratobasidium sp. 395]
MGATLNESDIHVLHEHLGVIFAPESSKEAVCEALKLLTAIIEPDKSIISGNGSDEENSGPEDATVKDRTNALKQEVLATKPNFFAHLLMLPKDEDTDLYVGTFSPKSEAIVEMLRNFPPAKLAFAPYVDQLLQSSFRENSRQGFILRVQDRMTRAAVAELLRPDPAAVDANKATKEALLKYIQSFSEILSPSLQADNTTEALAKKQQALACGLLSITEAPLHPDATPVFIQVGGLDALLAIIHRGPLSIPDMESPNESVDDACDALFRLMDDSGCEVLVDALVERQAISPLLKQMAHVYVLEGMYNRASLLVRKLVAVSRSNETLRKQVIAEAKTMVASNPKNVGPGATAVLWDILQAAKDNAINEMKEVSKSKKYVPFFLAPCKLGASDDILDTVGEALAARVGQPGDQLRKGVSTPEQVEKFVFLIEHACTWSAADISPTIRVLRELILPADQEATGSVNGHFCRTFGKAIKTRFNAAQALASRVSVGEGNEVQEPSEEGLANMKNVKMLSVIVDEQYSALTLIVEADLLEYLQYLAFNPRSPLSRRAGLELITALTHDSSLSSDFEHVPDVIDGFMSLRCSCLTIREH